MCQDMLCLGTLNMSSRFLISNDNILLNWKISFSYSLADIMFKKSNLILNGLCDSAEQVNITWYMTQYQYVWIEDTILTWRYWLKNWFVGQVSIVLRYSAFEMLTCRVGDAPRLINFRTTLPCRFRVGMSTCSFCGRDMSRVGIVAYTLLPFRVVVHFFVQCIFQNVGRI